MKIFWILLCLMILGCTDTLTTIRLVKADCVPYNISSWTQDQKNQLYAASYDLNGKEPKVTFNSDQSSAEVCIDNATILVSSADILSKISQWQAARDAAQAQEQTKVTEWVTESQTNEICIQTLATVNNKIDTAFAAATTVAEVKSTVKVILKIMAKCIIVNRELNKRGLLP